MNNIPFLLGMKLYFMLDYINGGNLYENLKRIRRFSEEETKFIVAQVVIAIAYLHKNKIIHRDLKPENIMMRENGYCVLADFGLSKILKSKNDLAKTCVGTDEYMAPELIRKEGHSFALDWWTVGVLTYELVVGRSPFLSKNPRKIHSNICKNDIQWPDPDRHRIYISDTMKDFIEKLLEKEPKYRLGARGAQEVFKHEWLSDIDFDKILNFKVKAPYKPRIDRIDEEKDENLLTTYQKRKKDEEKKALLETCLGESRKQLIRDYQGKFKEF